MKLASIKPNELAIADNGLLIPVGENLARQGVLPSAFSMLDLIARYDEITEQLERIFLKPPSALTGPEQNIIIPKGAETIFPELELCVVIGKQARHVPKEGAFDAIFGYTIMLDVTARGYGTGTGLSGTRCVRKGFESFAPIGPWITTKDEIADPHRLWMKLWINGELIQSARTDAMVNGIPELVSYLSEVTTLYPGDLITTGNPDSPEYQKKLESGDLLKAEIEGIGAMNLGVAKEN